LKKKSVRVVIPIYKTDLSETELFSLKRSLQVLKKHQFTIVCPEGLDIEPIIFFLKDIDYDVKLFSPDFFKNIDGYNRLMLSESFYNAFSNVDYVLICQTDVFVFKDELDFWCSNNFDYIGAPWIGSTHNFYNISLEKISNIIRVMIGKNKKSYDHIFKVGNGGFSLRKVKTHRLIVSKHKKLINYYIENHQKENYHIEDVFFSLKAPELEPDFSIPKWEIALKFCIDRKPKIAFKLNKNQLPFAIHRFDKPKALRFWKNFIEKL